MSLSKPKKLGIIGAGRIIEDGHLPVLLNIKEIEVAWVSDSNPQRSELISKMFGVPCQPIDSVMSLLKNIDLCLIAIPVGARRPYIEACARAGIPIYAEKPFARTIEEQRYFCSLFPDFNVAVGLQRRFFHGTQVMKDIIQEKFFGKLTKIELNHGQYSLKAGSPGRYITDSQLSGGGVIIESSIHCLDQILYCTQAEAVTVRSAEAVVFNNIDYETTVDSSLAINDGSNIGVHSNHTSLRNLENGFVFYFEKASVFLGILPDSLPLIKSLATSQSARCFSIRQSNGSWALTSYQSFYLSWIYFLKGIEDKTIEITSAARSYLTMTWVDTIYKKIFV